MEERELSRHFCLEESKAIFKELSIVMRFI